MFQLFRVEEGSNLFSMTLRIKLGSRSKTRESQIIVTYEEICSNSYNFAEMRDTKFLFSRDIWAEPNCPGCRDIVALGMGKESRK